MREKPIIGQLSFDIYQLLIKTFGFDALLSFVIFGNQRS